jgi:glycerophosphoryl diester phosphodiesterase
MNLAAQASGPSSNRFLARLRTRGDFPMVVAHRGDSYRAPENTMEAALLGWQAGADAWELDVQLSRDGVPIILHDESLLRTTDVALKFAGDPRSRHGFRVSDFEFDEVRSLDAGSWFVNSSGSPRSARAFGTLENLDESTIKHYFSGGVVIPTLAEALQFTRDHDWLVNVEIKSVPERPRDIVGLVLQEIAGTGTDDRVVISSFDHRDVVAANVGGREFGLGILVDTPLYRLADYTTEIVGADTVHASAESVGSGTIAYRRDPAAHSLEMAVIYELHGRGIPLLVYTVNDHGPESLASHFAQLGVAGLFTDDPQGMRGYFRGTTMVRGPGI